VRSGPALLLLLAAAAAAPLAAQDHASAPVTLRVAPVTVPPGGRTEAKVTLEIAPGYRILAPGTQGPWGEPPLLSYDAADGVFAEPPEWPSGKAWRSAPGEPEVRVYEGKVELKVVVHAGPRAAGRTTSLPGRLRYQPIRGDFFMKVATLPVTMPVELLPPKGAAKPAAPPAATRP